MSLFTSPDKLPPDEHIRAPLSEQVYLNLLGLKDLPDSPEDITASEIFLSDNITSDIGKAIASTRKDNLERSQDIAVNKHNLITRSPIRIGNEFDTGNENKLLNLGRTFRIAPKGLVDFHTHPKNVWMHSRSDVARAKAFPNIAFIHAVGVDSGVGFLFQTKKALKGSFLPTTEFDKTIDLLLDNNWPQVPANQAEIIHYWTSRTDNEAIRMSSILNSLGFAYYEWLAPTGYINQEDFLKGVVVKKVPSLI